MATGRHGRDHFVEYPEAPDFIDRLVRLPDSKAVDVLKLTDREYRILFGPTPSDKNGNPLPSGLALFCAEHPDFSVVKRLLAKFSIMPSLKEKELASELYYMALRAADTDEQKLLVQQFNLLDDMASGVTDTDEQIMLVQKINQLDAGFFATSSHMETLLRQFNKSCCRSVVESLSNFYSQGGSFWHRDELANHRELFELARKRFGEDWGFLGMLHAVLEKSRGLRSHSYYQDEVEKLQLQVPFKLLIYDKYAPNDKELAELGVECLKLLDEMPRGVKITTEKTEEEPGEESGNLIAEIFEVVKKTITGVSAEMVKAVVAARDKVIYDHAIAELYGKVTEALLEIKNPASLSAENNLTIGMHLMSMANLVDNGEMAPPYAKRVYEHLTAAAHKGNSQAARIMHTLLEQARHRSGFADTQEAKAAATEKVVMMEKLLNQDEKGEEKKDEKKGVPSAPLLSETGLLSVINKLFSKIWNVKEGRSLTHEERKALEAEPFVKWDEFYAIKDQAAMPDIDFSKNKFLTWKDRERLHALHLPAEARTMPAREETKDPAFKLAGIAGFYSHTSSATAILSDLHLALSVPPEKGEDTVKMVYERLNETLKNGWKNRCTEEDWQQIRPVLEEMKTLIESNRADLLVVTRKQDLS